MKTNLTTDEQKVLVQPKEDEEAIPQEEKPYKVYQTKEEWQADVDKIVKRRLAEQKRQLMSQTARQETEDTPEGESQHNSQIEPKGAQRGRKGGNSDEEFSEHDAQIEELRRYGIDIIPYFDDPEFVKLVNEGYSLISAYFNIMQKRAKNEAYDNLSKKKSRIMENGLGNSRATSSRFDPSKLSDAEFSDLLERVRKGAVIHEGGF